MSAPLISMASAAQAVTGTVAVDTSLIHRAALDISLASFTGGTTPSVTFFLERSHDNSTWFQVYSTGALSAAVAFLVDLAPEHGVTGTTPPTANLLVAQHCVFPDFFRLRWTTSGAPTAVTFAAFMSGRWP